MLDAKHNQDNKSCDRGLQAKLRTFNTQLLIAKHKINQDLKAYHKLELK